MSAQEQHDEAVALRRRQGRELDVELLKQLTTDNPLVYPEGPIGKLMRKHSLTQARAEELWIEFGG